MQPAMSRRTFLSFVLLTSLLATGVDAAVSGTETASPAAVHKVVQMLLDMTATAKQAKKDEQVAFAEFSTWCTEGQTNLKNQIGTEAVRIETLSSTIAKLSAEIKQLVQEIAQLHSDVAGLEADLKTNAAQRAKDRAAFVAEEQDYNESVDALERAIDALAKEDYDRPGTSAALLQLSDRQRLPANVKAMIAAFVDMMGDGDDTPDHMSYQAPEANAYEFQSGNIVVLLKKLRDEFRGKLAQSQKEEKNSQHASNMVIQDLTDSVENAKSKIDQKTVEKEHKSEELARSKKELAEAIKAKAEDEKMLSGMKAECTEKKLSFDEKQQLREEEIQALDKAVEILSSDVTGHAETHLGLAQIATGAMTFLQVERRGNTVVDNEGIYRRMRHLSQFLAGESKRLHSKDLSLLADKVAAGPFDKVKKMIGAMITRLQNEAHSDADHEGYCDKELGMNKVTRDKLSERVDFLSAEADEGKATITRLTGEIAGLAMSIADLDASVAQASELRKAEKAKNAKTIKDAIDAKKAVLAAIAILNDFYAKASTATAMVQVVTEADPPVHSALLTARRGVKLGSKEWDSLANPSFEGTIDKGHQAGMQTFGAKYEGLQSQAGGVLALLEVIASDFSTLRADTEAAEAQAQKAYEDFMVEARRDKSVKLKQTELDDSDKAAAESKLRVDTADIKSNQDQLLAAERYHAILVPKCIDQGMTFGERMEARQKEINSLKEALAILSRDDIVTSSL